MKTQWHSKARVCTADLRCHQWKQQHCECQASEGIAETWQQDLHDKAVAWQRTSGRRGARYRCSTAALKTPHVDNLRILPCDRTIWIPTRQSLHSMQSVPAHSGFGDAKYPPLPCSLHHDGNQTQEFCISGRWNRVAKRTCTCSCAVIWSAFLECLFISVAHFNKIASHASRLCCRAPA